MLLPHWVLLLAGCWLREEYPEPNCDPRTAYYPDEDGDGLGEPSDIYIGCEAPEGWVTKLGDAAADTGAEGEVTTDTGA